jgi:hypothetical protein
MNILGSFTEYLDSALVCVYLDAQVEPYFDYIIVNLRGPRSSILKLEDSRIQSPTI